MLLYPWPCSFSELPADHHSVCPSTCMWGLRTPLQLPVLHITFFLTWTCSCLWFPRLPTSAIHNFCIKVGQYFQELTQAPSITLSSILCHCRHPDVLRPCPCSLELIEKLDSLTLVWNLKSTDTGVPPLRISSTARSLKLLNTLVIFFYHCRNYIWVLYNKKISLGVYYFQLHGQLYLYA